MPLHSGDLKGPPGIFINVVVIAIALFILGVAIGVVLFIAHDAAFSQNAPDTDGDGFTDGFETYIGTSPASHCLPYENRQIDAFPPDLNRDNRVDIQDIALELQWFGQDVNRGYTNPEFNYQGPRYDLSPEPMGDGVVDISDLIVLATRFGQQC